MANDSNNKIGFLNLKNNGDVATIRVLHSSVNTIERATTHWINSTPTARRSVKCLGEGCPLCNANFAKSDRVYIHVFDFADMQEKVWTRTESFLNQLSGVEQTYGNLSGVGIRVIREEYRNFPSYRITEVLPPSGPMPGDALIDKKVAYRCFMTRTAEELVQFLTTGQMPDHKKTFVPKAQFGGNTATFAQGGTPMPTQPAPASTPFSASPVAQPTWTYTPTQTPQQTVGAIGTPMITPTTFPPQQTVPVAPQQDDPFSSPIFRV